MGHGGVGWVMKGWGGVGHKGVGEPQRGQMGHMGGGVGHEGVRWDGMGWVMQGRVAYSY